MTRRIEQRIRQSRADLENPYAYLNGEGEYEALVPEGTLTTAQIDMARVLDGQRRGRALTRSDIQRIVRNLHTEMWLHRAEILSTEEEVDPLQILDPELALRSLGYAVAIRESLGQHAAGRDSFEVAGIVDNSKETVEISRRFSPAIMKFTTAHELGHAVLHQGSGLHRDRGLDGVSIGPRDPREAEADTFAAYFLLPDKQVRTAFSKRFLTEEFRLNEASAFALGAGSLRHLQDRCRSERDLARILAAAQHYNGAHFKSLSERFGVSIEVVAIRLGELDLIAIG
jgi:Zn-dependent peptidase ImmA (M78 family)